MRIKTTQLLLLLLAVVAPIQTAFAAPRADVQDDQVTFDFPNTATFSEKLGFFILEYANHSTQLFYDPQWDDDAVEVIDEGGIDVSEPPMDSTDAEIISAGLNPDDPVPIASNEEVGTSTGIFEETDEETIEQLRYRMSEDFMRGQVTLAAESISFTGPDGRPLTADKFTVFQSELFLKKFKDAQTFNQVWKDIKSQRHFLETEAAELGLQIHALENIFASKYQIKEVDLYDVLSSMVYPNQRRKPRKVAFGNARHDPGL